MKRLALFLMIVPMAACVVGQTRFKAQQDEAAAQRKRADELDAKLSSSQQAAQKIQLDLKAAGDQLASAQTTNKAVADQLASAQTTNKDLQQALDAKKGELTQKVSELIKERDALVKKAAAAEAAKASADAARAASDSAKAAAETAAAAATAAAEAEKAAEVARVKKSYEDLTAGLKSEISAGEIKITQLQGKLTVNLVDRILFDSGKAEIKDNGKAVLDKLGSILNTVKDKNIRIEGHTDNKPITGELLAKYPSNWELSTARATAVARYLQDRAKVDPARLVATGYGEFHPVASNDTPESRGLNRRIEIVLVPRD
jgi:chemotaxis protein MotB